MDYIGDFLEDETIYIPWNTNAGSGASITRSTDGTIRIYKDGSISQKATSNGITDTEDFDGIVGTHLLTLDTSNDTGDGGFWVTGSDYMVMLVAATIDGETVNHIIAQFSIENRFQEVDVTSWLGTTVATPTVGGVPEVDLTHMGGVAQSAVDLKDFADDGYDPATNKVTGVLLVDTTTTNSDMVTEPPTAAVITDAVWDEPIEDHDTQGNMGWAQMLSAYAGSDGPGIYVDSNAANTNTVVGTDGTEINPVSTFVAARTLADAVGLKIYYLEGNADITLAATHTDWEFIGIGSVMDNVINLGSQDVSRSLFRNLTVEGTQGGSGRITARDCALQDPGAGDTTLHIFAERCGFVDRIQVDTSNDNVFDQCYSLVAGTAAPVIQATGASGTISIRHYSGGMEFESLSASHNLTWEGVGQVVFNVSCNVNANVSVRGIGSITDNTAGMASLTETSLVNMTKINTEMDTALVDVRLDELISATAGGVKPTVASIVDLILNKDGSQTFSQATDSLEGLADTAAAILEDTGTTLDTHLIDIKGTNFVKDTHSLIDIEAFVDILDDGTSGNAKIATDVAAILLDTAELQGDDVPGLIAALNDLSIADIFTYVIETPGTFEEFIKLMYAALVAKSTGGGGSTITFRDLADGKARITATVDTDGNRTAVTVDGS